MLRSALAAALAAGAALGLGACSSPSASARACSARDQMQTTITSLRGFDYATGSASTLADDLHSLGRELKNAEAAVALPQNTRLRQMGGTGHLRQTEDKITGLAQSLDGSQGHPPADLASVESEVRLRVNQAQQITDAITGC